MNESDLFAGASLEDLKRGYMEEELRYICICCGESVEKGIIYPEEGKLYEAGRYIRLHVEKAHGSAFDFLISLDKHVTGLSELQKNLLDLFYQGKSDIEVQKELGIGSTSTIRNHRFALREKERQARAFLAVMELFRDKDARFRPAPALPGKPPANTAAAVSEEEQVLARYMPRGLDGPMKGYPAKEKHRRILASAIAERFEYGRTYTEQEINVILEELHEDYALLRRALIDYGLLGREVDGSSYWRMDLKNGRNAAMSRRDELKQLAKETKIEGGIFAVRNLVNGKIWVESTRNFKTMNGNEFSLRMGSHMNADLQREWKEYGGDAFRFEVLEKLEKKESGYFDEKDALKKLKDKWLKELRPYGEAGYNSPKEEER